MENKVVQFPKLVKISQLWCDGLFGLTVDNIKEIRLHDTSILVWFSEGRADDKPWDFTLEYKTMEEAENSYNDLLDALRQIRFKKVSK